MRAFSKTETGHSERKNTMDDKGKKDPAELDGDKTVVIDRNELTELMTAPRGEHKNKYKQEILSGEFLLFCF